jgi:hypothetical protein
MSKCGSLDRQTTTIRNKKNKNGKSQLIIHTRTLGVGLEWRGHLRVLLNVDAVWRLGDILAREMRNKIEQRT